MKSSLEIISTDRTAMTPLEKSAASIQRLDPLAVPNWDTLVMALPKHTFFHTAAWARVLEQSYGYTPVYFGKVANGALRALLPMMEVNSWLTGKRGVSLPFTDACETLEEVGSAVLSGPFAKTDLIQLATEYGRSNGWKYIELRNEVGRDNGQSGSDPCAPPSESCAEVGPAVPSGPLPPSDPCAPSSDSFYGHTLELSRDEEKIFASFDSSVRRAIRKAEKLGVKVEISRSIEGVQTFYQLHCQTRRKHGVPPQPFSFFTNFHRNVIAHNLGFVVIARFEGRPIAAAVFVHFGTKAIYKYGASDEKFQNFRGANLAMWYGIRWYARAGYDRLDFGRTEKANEGLRRFKLGWGADERSINYFKYDLQANRFVPGKAESTQMRERIVRHIPIPIARIIGSVLYRHVA